jgi:hypothetical protein
MQSNEQRVFKDIYLDMNDDAEMSAFIDMIQRYASEFILRSTHAPPPPHSPTHPHTHIPSRNVL